jgi:hypothetical protein
MAKQIRVTDASADPSQVKGACVARHRLESVLRKREKWTLMLNSGSMLAKGWDDCVLGAMQSLPSDKAVLTSLPLPSSGKSLSQLRELLNEGPQKGQFPVISGMESGGGVEASHCIPAVGAQMFAVPAKQDAAMGAVAFSPAFSFAKSKVHSTVPYLPWEWGDRCEATLMLARFAAKGIRMYCPPLMPAYGNQADTQIMDVERALKQCGHVNAEDGAAALATRVTGVLRAAQSAEHDEREVDCGTPPVIRDLSVGSRDLSKRLVALGTLPGAGQIDAALALGYTLDDGAEGVLQQVPHRHADLASAQAALAQAAKLHHCKPSNVVL